MSKPTTTKEKELTSKFDPYKNKICDKSMSQEECELAILREAVDNNEEIQDEINKEKIVIDETITRIFEILEDYIIKKKLLLYGGFAINAVLPEYEKFYDAKHEIPDYDVYSPNALEDAIELTDFFFENGFQDVETKAGVHYMTYKLYVNFIPVADITILDKGIFDNLQKEAVIINRIHYCPVNFLRRNIYKELSQPQGNITRWEKIYKRLNKINENFPLEVSCDCENIEFQRKMDSVETTKGEVIYEIVKNAFIYLGAVFFGGYACSLYSQYMPVGSRKIIDKIPDFDVLYDDIVKGSQLVKEKLNLAGFKRVKLIHHENIGEIIPESYEIQVNNDTVAFIYKPNACYSYNIVHLNKQQIKVASIDTMLFFCYTFYYSSKPYHFRDRNLCIIKILFEVELENRLNQKGLLKRFSIECIGSQMNIAEIKEEKAKKFKKLFNKRDTREYSVWFLKYNPLFNKRPAFMKRRIKYKKVRFSLKSPRYRYLNTPLSYNSILHSESEIDDLQESTTSNPTEQSVFLSDLKTRHLNKKVRKTHKKRKTNPIGDRSFLQYKKKKEGNENVKSEYDILSTSPSYKKRNMDKDVDENENDNVKDYENENENDNVKDYENENDNVNDSDNVNEYENMDKDEEGESKYDILSNSPPYKKRNVDEEYDTTKKYRNIYTRSDKPFNTKRYTKVNNLRIFDSVELYKKQKQKKFELNKDKPNKCGVKGNKSQKCGVKWNKPNKCGVKGNKPNKCGVKGNKSQKCGVKENYPKKYKLEENIEEQTEKEIKGLKKILTLKNEEKPRNIFFTPFAL